MWRAKGGSLTLAAGPAEDADGSAGPDRADLIPIPDNPDYYFAAGTGAERERLGDLLAQLVASERDTMQVAEELVNRYEEIDLLYTISDILGRTIRLQEAARIIAREVSTVVGAQRASILVHDAEAGLLRPVAGWGVDVREFDPVDVNDPDSVAARVFREVQPAVPDSLEMTEEARLAAAARGYKGASYLSVPITYPDQHGIPTPVGVINLTDRIGSEAFGVGHGKMVAAIAHQIGAAIENARLVARDLEQQRVRRELELAHDLQVQLLPSTDLWGSRDTLAARFEPAEVVGGDFYQFVQLPEQRLGIMLGDVSTHGFRAALIMALVLSAAGIQAAAAESPELALSRLLASVRPELANTEMFVTLFYAVVDPSRSRLRFANAGHPHAFRIPKDGPPERLAATAPPLGLDDADTMTGDETGWVAGSDLLVLFSDGITEARDASGAVFGEDRVVEMVREMSHQSATAMVDAVLEEVSAFSTAAADDRTMVVLKA